MRIIPIPLFSDNFAYALYSLPLSSFLLVDPAHFQSVSQFIARNSELSSRKLTHILSTHKHGDHCGENSAFRSQYPDVAIVGGRGEGVSACSVEVDDNSEIYIEDQLSVKALHTPCHTRGHIVYYIKEKEQSTGVAFTGDTLFIGGCGRFFEGTASEMYSSLQKLTSLPEDTELYPGHEYTIANLTWAAQVDQGNEAVNRKLRWAEEEVAAGRSTVPSVLREELTFNPFLRARELMGVVGASDPVSALGELRRWKNEGKTSL